jgi:hypothetical protein
MIKKTKTKSPQPIIAPPSPVAPPSFPISTVVVRGPAPAVRQTRSLAGRTVGDIAKLTVPPERDYLLLDRSGSMGSLWSEALKAINAYAGMLGSKVNTRIMMAVFDDLYQVIRNQIHPSQWRPVTDEEVMPRGNTALNDAIGRLVAQAKADNPAKAAIVIMTDSGENASKEVTDERAKALLDECRGRGWQVIFLGMGHDNSGLAAHYGADPNQTIAVGKDSLAVTMRKAAEKRASYAQTGKAISFTDVEKKDAGRLLLTRR